jgi:hypothetical protein
MQNAVPTELETCMVALIMLSNKQEALKAHLQQAQKELGPEEVVDLANINSSFQVCNFPTTRLDFFPPSYSTMI